VHVLFPVYFANLFFQFFERNSQAREHKHSENLTILNRLATNILKTGTDVYSQSLAFQNTVHENIAAREHVPLWDSQTPNQRTQAF
jgi:hypothetical protein